MRFLVAFCLLHATAQAFFSINYAADESHPSLMTPPGVFKDAPKAEHVADIYARLSGRAPLFWEGLWVPRPDGDEDGCACKRCSSRSSHPCVCALAGASSLSLSGKENMPAIDVLADTGPAPILLEINGGSESPRAARVCLKSYVIVTPFFFCVCLCTCLPLQYSPAAFNP
jgi:hypothetical protein